MTTVQSVAQSIARRSMPYLLTEWLREHARTDTACRVCKKTPRDPRAELSGRPVLDVVARSGKYGAVEEYECSLCVQLLTPESKALADERRTGKVREQARERQEKRRAATSPQEEPVTLKGPGQVLGQTPPLLRDSASSKSAKDKESGGGVDMTLPKSSTSLPRGGRPRVHTDRKAAQKAASKAYRERKKTPVTNPEETV